MKHVLVLTLCLFSTGCQLGYYLHLAGGQRALMAAREPVEDVLADPDVPSAVRHKLQLSQQLRVFAQQALQLPVDDTYLDYVALDRDWVTWNLFVAPPLSLTPRQWCYPIVGCASYHGYFDRERAQRDADKLEHKGFDVYGAGAIAYSTLGWFDDPVTSPMLAGPDDWFAELLFHELAHRRFYLKGDTRFNESLATTVGRAGMRQWLASREQDRAEFEARLRRRDLAREKVLALVGEARNALGELYASSLTDAEKLSRRDGIREALRQAYRQAREQNIDLASYRDWFNGPLNNAQLATLSDYEGLVPGFDAILARCGGDWSCFWKEVEQIAQLPAEQRNRLLEISDA